MHDVEYLPCKIDITREWVLPPEKIQVLSPSKNQCSAGGKSFYSDRATPPYSEGKEDKTSSRKRDHNLN
jgi:hypothetical protein